jgi:phosphohistidine phosphatase SixA
MKFISVMAMAIVLAACSSAEVFDRSTLLSLVSEADRAAVGAADRNILVVRHARKVTPDCNALDCGLSETGQAMVEALAGLLADQPVDMAYSSAACRTRLTAEAGGRDVVVHQALDGYENGCTEGETVLRTRSEAFAEARDAMARWTLVGEHSNTSCLWIAEFAGEDGASQAGCTDGRLADTAYGDIFWLYRNADDQTWSVVVLAGAFEVADAQ